MDGPGRPPSTHREGEIITDGKGFGGEKLFLLDGQREKGVDEQRGGVRWGGGVHDSLLVGRQKATVLM